MRTNRMRICLNCNHLRAISGRGLCCTCFKDLEIRAKFPLIHLTVDVDKDEQTMEELNAMIAEQLPTMPRDPAPKNEYGGGKKSHLSRPSNIRVFPDPRRNRGR